MFLDKQRKGILILIAFILVLGLAFRFYERLTPPPGGIIVRDEEPKPRETSPPATIYVQICGAVKNPGVYRVQKGARLFEVVNMAGGLSPNADAQKVNLAKVVEDGEKVCIPRVGDVVDSSSKKVGDAQKADSKLINVNQATVEELERLPGIGRTIAKRIVEYREKNGPFNGPSDLLKVKGIGEKKLEKIRGMITF